MHYVLNELMNKILCSKDENTQYGCVSLWNKNWRFREKSVELKCDVVTYESYAECSIFLASAFSI